MLLASLLLFAQAPEVTGLRPGESAVVVEAASIPSKDDKRLFVRPRAVDAVTGAPLGGVKIETWSENGVQPSCAQMRLDVATTGRDGFARVCFYDGSVRGDKVRFSKAGYASYENSPEDAEIPMYPARTLEGRVLDLEGHPVLGATVRTHYTCAHAIPASETQTDALGRFRMEDYPPLSPEVEVVDLHHEPLFQRDSADWWTQASFYGQLDLYVARRQPIEVMLVDAAGEPLAGRFIIHTEAPSSGAWTDGDGRCTLMPATHPFMDFPYEVLDSTHRAPVVGVGPLLVDGEVTRIGIFDGGHAASTDGRILVHLDGLGGLPAPKIVFAPEKGLFDEMENDSESNVQVGPARILVGGRFTGFLQESRDVVVTSKMQRIDITLRREPRLRMHMVDPDRTRVVVQAGDDSVEAPAMDGNGESDVCEQGVPPGVPIAILWEREDGGLRRVLLPPIDKDTDVDLQAESTILRHGMREQPAQTTTVKYVVTDSDGRPIPKAEGSVYAAPTSLDFAPGEAGSFAWTLQAHAHYRIEFKAPGFSTAYLEGVVPLQAPDQPKRIVLTRRAHLEIAGKVTLIDGFLGGAEATDGGVVMEVAPGPLSLVLAREGKLPIALDLVLAPGDQRRISIP